MKIIIPNSANPKAYPISGFSWLLIYENGKDQAKTDAVARLAWWMIHDGQKYSAPLLYAPLQGVAVKKAENLLMKITVDGKVILATN